MVCPRCGVADNPADALYCENCGDQLSTDGQPAAPSLAVSDLPVPPAVQQVAASATPAENYPAATVAAASASHGEPPPPVPPKPALDLDATMQLPPLGWTCADCGALNDESDGFCVDCGAEHAQGPPPLQPGQTFAGWRVVAASATGYEVAGDGVPAALLRFGDAAVLADTADVLSLLNDAAVTDAGVLAATVAASGVDAKRGAYVVLVRPSGAWQPLPEAGALTPSRATAVLRALLVAGSTVAAARRALLSTPASVLVDPADPARLLLDTPVAPALPLQGQLLADPAFLPPELLPGAASTAEPFRVAAFAVAETLHRATGSALGFPPRWHLALHALRAADPAARPANLAAALALLDAGTNADAVGAHRTAWLTDIGHHHPVNQDAGGVWSWQRADGVAVTLAAVCDGVSAGEHSEDASKLAIELLHGALDAHWADADLTPDRAEELLRLAGMEAQRRICAMPASSYERANASTLVAACVIGGEVAGIWCGDSRAYGVTADGVVQLTKDHSWVNLVVDSGRMTLDQARNDPRAHVIARWLGASESPHSDPGFDAFRMTLAPGDRLLLCSDGLYMYFDPPADDPQQMGVIALEHGPEIEAAVDELVGIALDRGGFDNVTAVLVEMLPAAPAT
jgi:PPM family protein phosphatase